MQQDSQLLPAAWSTASGRIGGFSEVWWVPYLQRASAPPLVLQCISVLVYSLVETLKPQQDSLGALDEQSG